MPHVGIAKAMRQQASTGKAGDVRLGAAQSGWEKAISGSGSGSGSESGSAFKLRCPKAIAITIATAIPIPIPIPRAGSGNLPAD